MNLQTLADHVGVSLATMWRMEHGKCPIPDDQQTKIIAEALGTDPEKLKDYFDEARDSNELEWYHKQLNNFVKPIAQHWWKGELTQAVAIADYLCTTLRDQLADKTLPGGVIPIVYDTYAKALYEKSEAHSLQYVGKDIIAHNTPIYEDLLDIANRTGEKKYAGTAHLVKGHTYYLAEEFETAYEAFSKAWPQVRNADHQLAVLRTWTIVATVLADKDRYKKLRYEAKKIIKDIESGLVKPQLEIICTTYEGWARAQSKWGDPEAYTTLKRAIEVYGKIRKRNRTVLYLAVQIARTTYELEQNLGPAKEYLPDGIEEAELRPDLFPSYRSLWQKIRTPAQARTLNLLT